MISVCCDGYQFDFDMAIDAFVFDSNGNHPKYAHCVSDCLSAVDVIAEFSDRYYFIEIKGCKNNNGVHMLPEIEQQEKKYDKFKQDFSKKYKDTLLYRAAEGRFDKPIYYICLLNFDSSLITKMNDDIQSSLPIKRRSERWKQNIMEGCMVVSPNNWIGSMLNHKIATLKSL